MDWRLQSRPRRFVGLAASVRRRDRSRSREHNRGTGRRSADGSLTEQWRVVGIERAENCDELLVCWTTSHEVVVVRVPRAIARFQLVADSAVCLSASAT
jgi:hypothetical protein